MITGKPNNPRDQAMLFARTLERESWRFGNCEDDIIIFYSVEDKEVSVMGSIQDLQRTMKLLTSML